MRLLPAVVPSNPLATSPPTARVQTGERSAGYELVELESPEGLSAAFAPAAGMACCSLRHRGTELIGERYGLEAHALNGTTMGMSLVHPWADHLSSWTYVARGRTVHLPISPLLHTDGTGLPVNGVHPSSHAWRVGRCDAADGVARLEAVLRYEHPRQLALFPFRHTVSLSVALTGRSLSVGLQIDAIDGVEVPVCFGYRIYLRRETGTTVVLPERRRLATDERLIPTGATSAVPAAAWTAGLAELSEVSRLGSDHHLTIASCDRRVTVEPQTGFEFAHLRSLRHEPQVMVEALTVAPDALGHDRYPVASPGRPYRASLRLSVDELLPEPSASAGDDSSRVSPRPHAVRARRTERRATTPTDNEVTMTSSGSDTPVQPDPTRARAAVAAPGLSPDRVTELVTDVVELATELLEHPRLGPGEPHPDAVDRRLRAAISRLQRLVDPSEPRQARAVGPEPVAPAPASSLGDRGEWTEAGWHRHR